MYQIISYPNETVSVISAWIKRSLGLASAQDPRPAAEAVLQAAREPYFFTELGVPDTFDGRYELVALHLHLLLLRLRVEGEGAERFSQGVFDFITGHFDEALREIGVGDMSVGKRAKTMTAALYGRLSAYDEGLAANEPAVLQAALARNLFGTVEEPDPAHLAAMASFMQRAVVHLQAQPLAELAGATDLFPSPQGLQS